MSLPRTPLEDRPLPAVAYEEGRVLCADIGGSFVDFAVFEQPGRLHGRSKRPTPVSDFDALAGMLAEMCADYPKAPLHIAIAGTQDPVSGIAAAANIPCVDGIALQASLEARLGRVVRVANDADCFAIGEAHFGLGRGHGNVFGVILGTGAGGALILNGTLVTGPGGVAGEWGHAPIVPFLAEYPDATPCFVCGCGQRGCLDTIASARGLERLYRWCGGESLDSRAIVTAWEAGAPCASRAVAAYLDYVSAGLAMAINLTGASIVPVGGGLSNAAGLIDALDHAVRARLLRRQGEPLLVPGILGHEAALLGAAALS